jgi:hypothetical protein
MPKPRSTAAERGMLCFRLPPDLRNQVEIMVQSQGITLSDFYRSLTLSALGGESGFAGGVSEGYAHARALAGQLARLVVEQAHENLPDTFEEALARLGIEPAQVGPDGANFYIPRR